ncbi:MAG: N-acetyl sugar amidotransferase [Christensenellales bacterium]
MSREYQVCTNCVMDTTDSVIVFDEQGRCDHCNNFYNNILPNWHPDENSMQELLSIVEKIKSDCKDKEYDCIIGISGGVDSSYLAYYAKEVLGLRPLLYAVDIGWNLDVANSNVRKIADGIDAKLITEALNKEEVRALQLAYFKSQVPYQDTVQDHLIFASLYRYAINRGIKYVLTGANYSTECVREPIEWVYQNDLRQIKDIYHRFGTIRLKTLPFCGMFKYRLYYPIIKGMRVIKPLNLISYLKEDVIRTLEERFGWERYKNKHYESRFTRFYEGYWLIKKFNYDKRKAHFSSLILTGQLDREEALRIIAEPPYPEEEAMEDMRIICEDMGITVKEFKQLMAGENKTYKDYKNSAWLIELAVRVAKFLGVEKRNFR